MATRRPTDRLKPAFFENASQFRDWLEQHHAEARELWVGYYKKASGRPSMTWQESVDEALCFGWIDGVRKTVDEISYANRFTPRKPGSNWSAINIRRAEQLIASGLMHPAGLAAFEKRDKKKALQYSFERDHVAFDPAYEREFKRHKRAWEFFASQPPYYRKQSMWWVMSAKQEQTRRRRLETLIRDSAAEQRIGPMRRPPRPLKRK
jgi:uncharacterized protein YdeI (YjbR/CyaY-like superfamily)